VARAHRNRIAAQNSRDRRKAQFTYLERRVAELEEENKQLRAGMGMLDHRKSEALKAEELRRESVRERENEELRERIKTLERGWDSVVKALAAQGLPTGTSSPSASTVTSPENDASPHPPTSAFPVLVPSSPTIFPISPAPSHTSLSSSNLFSEEFEFELESTRHLARVATTEAPPPSMSLQRVDSRQKRIISSALTSALGLRRLAMHQRQRHHRYTRPSTTQPWKISCATYSRPPLPSRRRLYLWTLMPTSHKSHPRRRWPPPRRR